MVSGQLIFYSSLIVQSYARQLNILTNWTRALGVFPVLSLGELVDAIHHIVGFDFILIVLNVSFRNISAIS
jgi:hypothetical protein